VRINTAAMKPGLLYRILKLYLPLVFRIFYRRIQIHRAERVPLKGPVIFAINHQNAFMDAIVVATASRRNPWFLTRAGVFASSVARYWLKKLQMIPIYRFRDGHAEMKRNDETLALCKKLIFNNQAILIFPEGNHNPGWRLRPLQKGIARIAFAAESDSGFKSGLQIVPVGLQYENHFNTSSDLLISFGEPIATQKYRQLYEENPAKATHALLQDVRVGIMELMVHVPESSDYEHSVNLLKAQKNRPKDLIKRLHSDQAFMANIPDPVEVKNVQNAAKPFCWLAYYMLMVVHLPALMLVHFAVKKIVKDPAWTSSIKVAALAFGAPIVHLLQAVLLFSFVFSWIWLPAYLLLLWISAAAAAKLKSDCIHL